ncbi:hypothetical protein L207DRAFT_521975 [Hyaloscypha variabilis F]|uniref:Amidoligase enzyme n=1 Tax=Hyaloscypha variabilis (strain UAMH 11265 / GT02V1 / F) TaxID=1149755 RepID=A0A2J6SCY6_HYAVF|nr:hypothetical protein L207DRAFT_521975 [Hyaloscypha variabilis F]
MRDSTDPLFPIGTYRNKKALSVGVEIEFVVATAPVNEIDPEPSVWGQIYGMHDEKHHTNWKLVGAHMCKTLNNYGIPAELYSGKHAFKPQNSAAWVVKTDESICAPEPGLEYEWAPIEINSPAFYFNQAGLNQIREVCSILARGYRISCNRSCGTHVHVGNAMKGLSFEAVKNLMALLYTFERQIDTIHPPPRCYNLALFPSLRENSNLAMHPQVNGDPSKGLEILLSDGLKSFDSLKELIQHDVSENFKMRYHLGDLCALLEKDSPDGNKRTIEFRQHKSTLNGAALSEWAEFCVRLVEFADDVPQELLYPWLRAHIGETPTQYSLSQVACKIGAPWMVPLLLKRIEANAKEEKWRKKMSLTNAAYDDAKCYTIDQGLTDPQERAGLTFTPIMFNDFRIHKADV